MSTPDLPPIPLNIGSLAGPPLIGVMFNWGLYGALTVQIYIYTQFFRNDKKWIKTLVYGLYITETAQTALATADIIQWFVIGFGNMVSLSKPFMSSVDAPIMDGIIALIVQLFFCWRIWILSRQWLLSGIIGVCALAQMAGALAVGIRSIEINNVTKMQSSAAYAIIWYTGSALADTLIAIAMTWLLMRHHSNFYRGGDLLRRIVRLTIETNTVTALTAITGLVTFLVFPQTSIFMVPSLTIGKLYTNTLMVIFNNRIFLSDQIPRDGDTTRSRIDFTSCPPQTINISHLAHGTPHVDEIRLEVAKGVPIESDIYEDEYK